MGGRNTLSSSEITRLIRLKTNNGLYTTDASTSTPARARVSGVSFSPFAILSSGDCRLIQNIFGGCKTTSNQSGPFVEGVSLLGGGNNDEFDQILFGGSAFSEFTSVLVGGTA